MIWLGASCGLLMAVFALLFLRVGRRLVEITDNQKAMRAELAEVSAKVGLLRAELQVRAHERMAEGGKPLVGDSLAAMEGLADPVALASDAPLANLAARFPPSDFDSAGNIFQNEKQSLAVARLHHQGHSAAEIARRMHLPIGEVELVLSLRPRSSV